MEKNLYIDASHPEETRIVLKSESSIEEYEFENKNKLNFKNNIYLGIISRVEPSLQAAFLDYGGNRHGFLAFSEIHPDYYQIPKADKDALLEEQARAEEKYALERNNELSAEEDEKNYGDKLLISLIGYTKKMNRSNHQAGNLMFLQLFNYVVYLQFYHF